jgi:FKBP-type peptidyl-prolyl cis-trans isomerase (trigger factor)
MRPAAEDRLKRRLILEQVAELEELEADPDELEAEIERFSEMAGEESTEMRAMLESPEGRESVASDLVMTLAQERVVQIGRGEIEDEAEPEPEAEEGVEPEAEADVEPKDEVEVEAEDEVEEEEPAAEAEAGEDG